jgi:hypothetical protein
MTKQTEQKAEQLRLENELALTKIKDENKIADQTALGNQRNAGVTADANIYEADMQAVGNFRRSVYKDMMNGQATLVSMEIAAQGRNYEMQKSRATELHQLKMLQLQEQEAAAIRQIEETYETERRLAKQNNSLAQEDAANRKRNDALEAIRTNVKSSTMEDANFRTMMAAEEDRHRNIMERLTAIKENTGQMTQSKEGYFAMSDSFWNRSNVGMGIGTTGYNADRHPAAILAMATEAMKYLKNLPLIAQSVKAGVPGRYQ